MTTTKLPIKEIKPNPNNPRLIKDEKYASLLKSIQEFPEMSEAREIIINTDHVILGGNMRFRAMKEAGWTEVPVKIVDWPEDKQRRFVIQDNNSGGDWDWETLANEWDTQELADWGTDLPSFIENMGKVDHFRDQDEDSNLDPVDEYNNRTSNTVILIYDNGEYQHVIEGFKTLMEKGYGDSPSKIVKRLIDESL